MNKKGENNSNLIKYLVILKKSSKYFQLQAGEFRLKYLTFISPKKAIVDTGCRLALNNLMDRFLILTNETNNACVLDFLMTFDAYGIDDKYAVYDFSNFGKEKLKVLAIDKPSIVIQVHKEISAREWRQIWLDILDNERELKRLRIKGISFKNLEKLSISRTWKNIDLILEIYKEYKKTRSFKEVSNNMAAIKEKLDIKSKVIYVENEIKKMYKKGERLLKSFW